MPRDNTGCQSGLPQKESFVGPSSWMNVLTLSAFVSILQVSHSVMSVCGVSQTLNWIWGIIIICQVVVAHSAHPGTRLSPLPAYDILFSFKPLVEWEQNVWKFILFSWEMCVVTTAPPKTHRQSHSGFDGVIGILASCTVLFLCLGLFHCGDFFF